MKVLAPAGSFDSAMVAIEAGADAIYLGLNDVKHQRSRCSNFSRKELQKIVNLSNEKDVEINVTFNSSYNEDNFNSIREKLDFLENIRVDAIIISDIGLIDIIRKNHERLKIAFSVQGQCSNSDFGNFLREHGVHKLILDRNISIQEAKSIKDNTGLEVEMFAFGFQCYSQDSICYMGDYFAGEPCNVQCSQKVKFLDTGAKARFFFMKFQSALNHIPEMIEAGIDYIKIEGRQRSSGYVYDTTSIFKEAIHEYNSDPGGYRVKREWIRRLRKQAYHFEITESFYKPYRYRRDIIDDPSMLNAYAYFKDIFSNFLETKNSGKIVKELKNAVKIQFFEPKKIKKHNFSELR
ncbi:MAG: peptidase U32 family protein [Candidatus Woesearchaeota archaeon]